MAKATPQKSHGELWLCFKKSWKLKQDLTRWRFVLPRLLEIPSVAKFVMEHGLDHALIDELPSVKIKDPKLRKAWDRSHKDLTELLRMLNLEMEYNLDKT